MNADHMMSLLTMPTGFVTSAQKRGWNAINFQVNPFSVFLIQDNWRIRFVRWGEKKYWILDKMSDNGWTEVHTLFHPGTSRLSWVLVTFSQLINHFERMKFTNNNYDDD